jgi:D-alanyl-D-alanine carboxypeptidase
MNKEATKDGALNSHFNNPDGLPDINNYTTAYDLYEVFTPFWRTTTLVLCFKHKKSPKVKS